MVQENLPDHSSKKGVSPIVIIGALFFIFGFVTWLNSLLIPYLEIACELTKFQSFFVTFAFYIAYLVMAPISTRVLNKFGFRSEERRVGKECSSWSSLHSPSH